MNIVLCYPLSGAQLRQIELVAPQCVVIGCDQSTIQDRIFDADIFCGHAKVPIDWRSVVQRGRLKWIQSSAAGLDHCLVPDVVSSSILVTSASGLFRDQVAEQTMALIYGLVRRLPVFFRAAMQKSFERQPTDDLHGKTIGIIGFGGNGQRIAELLQPVGCELLAVDAHADDWNHEFKLPQVHQLLGLSNLNLCLHQSNIVILTLPLVCGTHQIVNTQWLQTMPRNSYLINVGRGGLVDETALVAALRDGQLAGAGLDVVAEEPLPESSPLWELENVLITPHVGAQSARRSADVTNLFRENLSRFFADRPLRNRVDKDLGYPLPVDRH